jgi:outer membrane immunogenic protein
MKRALFGSVATVALFTGIASVQAADMGQRYVTKAPVTAPIPFYNWNGFYVGVNGGWGWGNSNQTATVGGFALTTGDVDVSGGLIGGTLGFNYQIGPWVWGIEGDIGWANIDGDTAGFAIVPAGAVTGTFTTELNWLATVRGRIGYAFDRFLPYITGGVAFGGVRGAFAVTTPVGAFAAAGTDTQVGWTVGGGVEYGITPNLSLKAEYLYVDLGDNTVTPLHTVDFNTHIVRAGLNLRF